MSKPAPTEIADDYLAWFRERVETWERAGRTDFPVPVSAAALRIFLTAYEAQHPPPLAKRDGDA